MTDPEIREAADAMWDGLAHLGYVDARGGAEYERVFADDGEVYRYAQVAYGLSLAVAVAEGEV